MPILRYQTHQIPYQVVRSSRAKNIRLEWRSGAAKCVAPIGVSGQIVMEFIFKNADWLSKQLLREKKLSSHQVLVWPAVFNEGTKVPFLGRELLLTACFSDVIYRRGCRLFYPHKLNGNKLEKQVVEWLHKQAMRYALYWSKKITKNFGLKPKSINIRAQKSRWGSCGIHDDLFLNWRLICFPRRVFMYVVVHEHCHLKHRNHGKMFWGLVAKVMLDYKQHDKWLNKFGGFLGN